MQQKIWTVYMHVNKLNNKKYIGITSQPVKIRWGKNGSEYLETYKNGSYKHPIFARALKKYQDWNNDWEHIIYKENLSEEEAKSIEKSLIALQIIKDSIILKAI